MRTFVWLGIIMVLAFLLRSVFNIDAGFDAATARHLLTGNDPYYHWVTTSHVLETGRNLDFDSAINYPEGAVNHNPPLWTWLSALVAVVLKGLGVTDPVGTALNVMVAVWGALCAIPMYMIGRDLWGRKAGLWAAFFLALSAPHITRSFWGYADHDAVSIFFILLAVAFLVRGFRASHHKVYVERWGDGAQRGAGLRRAFAENRNTFVYAALAGLAITACAVTWKGYPYALGILGLAAVLQFIVDHLRHRDATVAWLAYLTTAVIAAVLPYLLYYRVDVGHLGSTVIPSLYVAAGIALAGLVLVPTRNLPSVLVIPTLLVAGIGSFVAITLLAPDLARTITSGLGYFNQSKLYSTIGEAQRPYLGTVAANLGFFTFLASFWGFAHLIKRAYKGNPGSVLVTAWAIIALFMMFAAARFIVNAAPLFALAMGYVMVRITAKLGGADVKKRFRSMHGQNPVSRGFRSLGWKTTVLSVLVGLLLIVPTVWIAADAGMSQKFKCEADLIACDPGEEGPNHFGAFGQAYELDGNGWLKAMNHLATLDTDKPLEDRPAFMAWWDYGHWARGIGQHPTVADPFQSHYELSGRFLASDTEQEAVGYLVVLLIAGDHKLHGGQHSPALQQLLTTKYQNLTALHAAPGYEAQLDLVRGAAPGDKVYTLYNEVMAATGKSVLYLGVDDRMGSFPATNGRYGASLDRGIFYAPVYLSDKNPDDYIQQKVQAGGQIFTVRRYAMVDNVSVDTGVERFYDAGNQEWEVYQGRLYRMGMSPRHGYAADGGLELSQQGAFFEPTERYGQTMFARAFGGLAGDGAAAGNGLAHWRAIEETIADAPLRNGSPHRQVVLLRYYNGVQASGSVVDDTGKPMAGVRVTFGDGFGAGHDAAVTDAQGHFSVLAPFSQDHDLRLAVLGSDGSMLWQSDRNDTRYQFTLAEAMQGGQRDLGQATVPSGSLAGTVYVEGDVPADGEYNKTAGKDRALAGARVMVGDRVVTTDANGTFNVGGLQAGSVSVKVSLKGYGNATVPGQVPAGGAGSVLVPLAPVPSPVTLTFRNADGSSIPDVPLRLTGPNGFSASAVTNATGVASTSLGPGAYRAIVDYNATSTEGAAVRYEADTAFDVPVGGEPVTVFVERK
jgi:dolichyl-diphosphooligosaccharide--protein glycosyltransferase